MGNPSLRLSEVLSHWVILLQMTPQTGAYASYESQTSNFCKIE